MKAIESSQSVSWSVFSPSSSSTARNFFLILPPLHRASLVTAIIVIIRRPDAALREHGAVGVIAQPLFTDYVVAFELAGILLLVAIVGAVTLAKKAS